MTNMKTSKFDTTTLSLSQPRRTSTGKFNTDSETHSKHVQHSCSCSCSCLWFSEITIRIKSINVHFNPIPPGGGGGGVSAPISTFENFLDI